MKKLSKTFDRSRRDVLRNGVAAAAGAVAAGALLRVQPAQAAQAKVAKASAMYQDKPHGKQSCGHCIHFIPGKTATADGTCQLVQGSISPNGWCVLFSAKA